ncbi:unnamed protein product [Brassicogethes aeneus]|uniref:Mif2/CENP-C cupin domain-containing protein n=1 Tax=Brassicogethes aeneus TaxID=1431903 RepID=A0A9P0AUI4_BRAAE|nr:unnamed protein product [Brassicogethes aeneus]
MDDASKSSEDDSTFDEEQLLAALDGKTRKSIKPGDAFKDNRLVVDVRQSMIHRALAKKNDAGSKDVDDEPHKGAEDDAPKTPIEDANGTQKDQNQQKFHSTPMPLHGFQRFSMEISDIDCDSSGLCRVTQKNTRQNTRNKYVNTETNKVKDKETITVNEDVGKKDASTTVNEDVRKKDASTNAGAAGKSMCTRSKNKSSMQKSIGTSPISQRNKSTQGESVITINSTGNTLPDLSNITLRSKNIPDTSYYLRNRKQTNPTQCISTLSKPTKHNTPPKKSLVIPLCQSIDVKNALHRDPTQCISTLSKHTKHNSTPTKSQVIPLCHSSVKKNTLHRQVLKKTFSLKKKRVKNNKTVEKDDWPFNETGFHKLDSPGHPHHTSIKKIQTTAKKKQRANHTMVAPDDLSVCSSSKSDVLEDIFASSSKLFKSTDNNAIPDFSIYENDFIPTNVNEPWRFECTPSKTKEGNSVNLNFLNYRTSNIFKESEKVVLNESVIKNASKKVKTKMNKRRRKTVYGKVRPRKKTNNSLLKTLEKSRETKSIAESPIMATQESPLLNKKRLNNTKSQLNIPDIPETPYVATQEKDFTCLKRKYASQENTSPQKKNKTIQPSPLQELPESPVSTPKSNQNENLGLSPKINPRTKKLSRCNLMKSFSQFNNNESERQNQTEHIESDSEVESSRKSMEKNKQALKTYKKTEASKSPRLQSPQRLQSTSRVDSPVRVQSNLKVHSPTKAPSSIRVLSNLNLQSTSRLKFQKVHSHLEVCSPTKVGSTPRVDSSLIVQSTSRAHSPIKVRSTPRVDSPSRVQSTSRAQSPKKVRSTSRVDSPSRVHSPLGAHCTKKVRSTPRVESPSRVQSTSRAHSPKKVKSTPRVDSPSRVHSPLGVHCPKKVRSTPRGESPSREQSPMKSQHILELPSPIKVQSPPRVKSPAKVRSLPKVLSPQKRKSSPKKVEDDVVYKKPEVPPPKKTGRKPKNDTVSSSTVSSTLGSTISSSGVRKSTRERRAAVNPFMCVYYVGTQEGEKTKAKKAKEKKVAAEPNKITKTPKKRGSKKKVPTSEQTTQNINEEENMITSNQNYLANSPLRDDGMEPDSRMSVKGSSFKTKTSFSPSKAKRLTNSQKKRKSKLVPNDESAKTHTEESTCSNSSQKSLFSELITINNTSFRYINQSKNVEAKNMTNGLSITEVLTNPVANGVMGFINLEPNAWKSPKICKKYVLWLFVLNGDGEVTIQNQKSKIEEYTMFTVPLGCSYSLKNLSNITQLKLLFVKQRDTSARKN